ncbi:TatD family hydrolase [Parvicella tangerina]|uniref:Metal-dependent hydrolase YcfH n=1 Tax=Parvicella tangerina TaxID=2829795 RepID=A0A916JKB8_9FLAO|nr:TatD family hydrolase [Parvicella tangerina]CAG5078204.1 putative metal-dependent hydrolase YcfH [Parvicella tangerina]
MLIDTHSHLYASQFDEDREDELNRCLSNGIEKVLLPNIDSESIQSMHDLVDSNPGVCYPMMGVHPCSIQPETWKEELALAKKHLFEGARNYIAVGEIGIDLYWDKSTLEIQQQAFGEQIQWAKEKNLPVVIHARDSFEEIFEVVDQYNDERLRGVFHCFTGGIEEATRIMDFGGFLMGLGGVLTFKNGGLDKTVAHIELKHFVLETDAPYLAPTPHRGKRNQSSYLNLVALKLADIKGCSLPEVAEITSSNAKVMFGLS